MLRIKQELIEREQQVQELKRLAQEKEHEILKAGMDQGHARGTLEGYAQGKAELEKQAEIVRTPRGASPHVSHPDADAKGSSRRK